MGCGGGAKGVGGMAGDDGICAAVGGVYVAFPNPNIKYPIKENSQSKTIPNTLLLLKTLAKSIATTRWKIILAIGMKYKMSHQPGRPTIFSKTYIL